MGNIFKIRNISDIKELEKIPLSERVKSNNVYEILESGAAINPNATAISFIESGELFKKPVNITYRQFISKIRQTANMLHDLGVGSTDVVTLLLPNLPETHYILWGAEIAGISNPINFMLNTSAIRDICIAAKTKILVAPGENFDADIWQKVDSIRKEIPSLKAVIRINGPSDKKENIYGFNDIIKEYPNDRLVFNRNINRYDVASLYYVGGTPYKPKLAQRTHFNEVVVSWDLMAALELAPGGAVLSGLPLFHCNGTMITGLAAFAAGAHLVMLSPAGFKQPSIVKNIYKIIEHYSPTILSIVPTILSILLDIPNDESDISTLKYVLCGSAPISIELFKKFEAKTGIKILEGYGLTEATVASCINPKDGGRKTGSIGIRLPYQEMKIAIVDDNNNYLRNAEIDEVGIVCVKGPCVFKGYLDSSQNDNIWIQDEWLNTGDLGRVDCDDFFWITGRKKDIIIRGGHNIDSLLIEEPLKKMPGINRVAAIGKPDGHAGEVPIAYVELNENYNITNTEILQWAQRNISERAAIPKEFIFLKKIPLTNTGLIDKVMLRHDIIKKVYTNELKSLNNSVKSITVDVTNHKKYSVSAIIRLKVEDGKDLAIIKKDIKSALSKYTVHFDVEFI